MIRNIARPIAPVDPNTLGEVVYDRFESEPDTLAIAVVDAAGRPVGLVERNDFFLKLAAGYGRALFAKRAISVVMDKAPLIVDAATSLDQFLSTTVRSSPAALLKGFIVVQDGRYQSVGAAVDLLAATSQENVRRAGEMEALAQERLLAKGQAESAHAWLRQAMESMNEAVAFFDADDHLVLWNQKYAQIIGPAKPILVLGAHFNAVVDAVLDQALGPVPPEPASRAETDGPGGRHIELADGRWIQLDDRALANGGRAIMGVDITELKRREESFRLLFDANPVAMFVFDRETYEILQANEAAMSQFARSRDELAGAKIVDFLLPEDREIAVQRLERPTGADSTPTYSVFDGEGRIRQIQPYQRPLRFNDRNALLCAVVDVTERKEAIDALAKARDAAEAANRAKSEFLANMSHEIRTPLNGVMGVAGALRRTKLSARQTEMVSVIQDSAESLHVLLADMLDLARVEAGKLEISAQPFDIRDLVLNITELFRSKAEEKGLSLKVRMRVGRNTYFSGDAVRIKQILGNLLSNAVKFTEQGSVSLTVESVLAGDGRGRVRFEVKDTGIGFDQAARERLFTRFTQADGSITRKFGGTGLGLSISSSLAALMGGDISAESEPGRGATFALELPLAEAAAPERETDKERAAAADEHGDAGTLRILAAEDHDVNRKVLQLMFEGLPVEVTMAVNGREAVERFCAEQFDLILMDMQMPEMDGLQATAAIREKELREGLPRTPIVMLTANALPEHEAVGRAAGADAFLTKPISAQALLSTVETTLAEVGQAQAA